MENAKRKRRAGDELIADALRQADERVKQVRARYRRDKLLGRPLGVTCVNLTVDRLIRLAREGEFVEEYESLLQTYEKEQPESYRAFCIANGNPSGNADEDTLFMIFNAQPGGTKAKVSELLSRLAAVR